MVPEGHREYKKREFCNDIPCFVQVELNKHQAGSEKYENVRKICSSACQFIADDFGDWLNQKSFKIGCCPKECVVESLPKDEWDVPMDMVVTD